MVPSSDALLRLTRVVAVRCTSHALRHATTLCSAHIALASTQYNQSRCTSSTHALLDQHSVAITQRRDDDQQLGV
jgi:hypothetical protein